LPKQEIIDYDMLEMSLPQKYVSRGLVGEIYDLLMESRVVTKRELTVDKKINRLIQNRIIIPVTEDLLLYHKDIEKYESQSETKKKDTRLKYIVGKIENVISYYSPN